MRVRGITAVVIAALTSVALLASSSSAIAATTTTGAACAPNSEAASTLTVSAQCIAEALTSTRGYVDPVCITDARSRTVYSIGDCKAGGIQAEAMAQARAVSQLNAAGVYGDVAVGGVTANLQWETVIPGGRRPDLLLYDRKNPGGAVGIVEMKGSWYGGVIAANADLTVYQAAWPATASGRSVVRYDFSARPFTDTF